MKNLNERFNKITKLMLSLLMIASMFIVSSCNDDDDMPPVNLPTENIMELVDKTASVSTLKAAIDAAGLRSVLSGAGPFTVFAPTDDAFAALDQDVLSYLLTNQTELTKVLTYHVVSGKVMSTDLSNGEVETLNNGEKLMVARETSWLLGRLPDC